MELLAQDEKVARVSMQIVRDCLVLSVQIDLYDATLVQLREDFLEKIRVSGVRRAIIDLSAVEIMDSHAFYSLCDTAEMAKVMGTSTVISGIGPGVASALVGLGTDTGRIDTCLNLEDGFLRLAELTLLQDRASGEVWRSNPASGAISSHSPGREEAPGGTTIEGPN